MPATTRGMLVTRRTDECDRPGEPSPDSVETKLILDWGPGSLFVEAPRPVDPGLTALGALQPPFSTVVLSTWGTRSAVSGPLPAMGIAPAGNLRLQRPTERPVPGTRALSLFSYGNELTLAMIVDPRWFRR